MPNLLSRWMYPISKTDLDVLRFAHFLALAAVTVYLIPQGLAGPEIGLAPADDPVRPAFAGSLLRRRIPGLCRPVCHRRAGRQRLDTFRYQYCRNRPDVRRGMAAGMVQGRSGKERRACRKRVCWRRVMRVVLGAVVIAGLLAAAPACAQDAKGADAVTAERKACDVPDDLLATGDVALEKVAASVKDRQEARCAGGRLRLVEHCRSGWRGGGLSRAARGDLARKTARRRGDGDHQRAAEAHGGGGGGDAARRWSPSASRTC